MKEEYGTPQIIVEELIKEDVLCKSGPENFSSYVAPPGDWGDDPIIDPDDDIIW